MSEEKVVEKTEEKIEGHKVGRPVTVGNVQAYQIYLTTEMKNYVLSQRESGSSFIRKLIYNHMNKAKDLNNER